MGAASVRPRERRAWRCKAPAGAARGYGRCFHRVVKSAGGRAASRQFLGFRGSGGARWQKERRASGGSWNWLSPSRPPRENNVKVRRRYENAGLGGVRRRSGRGAAACGGEGRGGSGDGGNPMMTFDAFLVVVVVGFGGDRSGQPVRLQTARRQSEATIRRARALQHSSPVFCNRVHGLRRTRLLTRQLLTPARQRVRQLDERVPSRAACRPNGVATRLPRDSASRPARWDAAAAAMADRSGLRSPRATPRLARKATNLGSAGALRSRAASQRGHPGARGASPGAARPTPARSHTRRRRPRLALVRDQCRVTRPPSPRRRKGAHGLPS